jgi:hypothetical protein
MSLGDAVAALFRAKPKRSTPVKKSSGFRPLFQQTERPHPRSSAVGITEDSPSSEDIATINSLQ